MTVAVTGASGHLGRRVAELLLDRLDPAEIVLVTRRPDGLADLAERGADVRAGDFDDPASLVDAFTGVERVLLISTDALGRRVSQHRAAIDAAKAAGARHLIYTSLPAPSDANPAAVAVEHRGTEDAVRDSGLEWTFLRNNIYAEYQVPTAAQALASGQLFTNAGDGRTAFVSRDDCAAAAAAVLAGAGHEGRAYDITGPEAVSQADLAAIAGELGGRAIDVVHLDDDATLDGMREAGLSDELAHVLTSFGTATRKGFLARVSTAVEDLTGREPRPLRDVLAAELAPTSSRH